MAFTKKALRASVRARQGRGYHNVFAEDEAARKRKTATRWTTFAEVKARLQHALRDPYDVEGNRALVQQIDGGR